ncbi:MAG: carboxymuconolactone decarboxylase family protein [Myxococcota bacterium]|nr:carboxymuconolactone decarboxylase family protein [Myxococcota bacterium]
MSEKTKAEKGLELAITLTRGAPPASGMPEAFTKLTLEHVFGDIWQRPGLELQERSMITVTTLVATGRESELRIHLNGALNLGISRETLEAMLTHIAHYAGWPVAVSAFRILDEVCAAREGR